MHLIRYSRLATWLIGLGVLALFTVIILSLTSFFGQRANASAPPQEDFKVTTVFLVRHAENAAEPRPDPPLLETGVARSELLARILAKSGVKAIYTSQFLRTKATAEPLAKQLGFASVPITLKVSASNPREISSESIQEIIDKIFQTPGDRVLVVGHSNSTPAVIKALGGDAAPIGEKDYDNLFVVTIYAKGKASVTQLKY
jgi:broad specificity phosphatase PhoE